MQERIATRLQASQERTSIRRILARFCGGLLALVAGIFIYLNASGREAMADEFLQDAINVAGGALGGAGGASLYQRSKKQQ